MQSKAGWFFISTALICIAVLAAYRGYGVYAAYVEKVNEERNLTPTLFSVVNADSMAGEAPQSAVIFSPRANNPLPARAQSHGEAKYIVYEDPEPLPTPQAALQQKAIKAYAKYNNNPIITEFNKDLQESGLGDMDFTRLNSTDFGQILQENPQLQAVLIKYAQNKEFLALLQQMMQDPEVQQVVAEIKNQK